MTHRRFTSPAPGSREERCGLGRSARWLLGALLPLTVIACGGTSDTASAGASSTGSSNSSSGSGSGTTSSSSSGSGAGGATTSSASSTSASSTSASSSSTSGSGGGGGTSDLVYKNPVVPGDFADPSVIRVGNEYWATATSSEWGPPYPLLHSTDLVNWDVIGSVFSEPPTWASAHFWAPEISEDKGQFYIFFTAQKTGGSLCVGSATAAQPGGPYVDNGPLVCQEAGSIDGFSIRDEKGTRYLLWKEDGNSVGKPTPIWAQELSEDAKQLLGDKEMLFQNDPSWEGNLVEGPFVLKRGEYFYAFYSGAGCCGTGCSYALGVARSKSLHGPWEKNPQNPILAASSVWKCPGHGSIVTTPDGRDYFLYHAYSVEDSVYVGRQGMLDEVVFGADEWPTINAGKGPSSVAPAPIAKQAPVVTNYKDEFTGTALAPGWQWPVAAPPKTTFDPAEGGSLVLQAIPQGPKNYVGAVVGRSTEKGDYEVKTKVTPDAGVDAGLSVYGDPENALGLSVSGGQLFLWRVGLGISQSLATGAAPGSSLYLRMTASNGHVFQFFTSTDGTTWQPFGPLVDSLAGNYDLPPWDRGLRAALFAKGPAGLSAKFDFFEMAL